jgi:DNA-binding transcriptional ArsR family regulator
MTRSPGDPIPALDRLIHEPARLAILTILSSVDEADFNYLITALGLSRGNLSSHMARLADAGYVRVIKRFLGSIPNTAYSILPAGREALRTYWEALDGIRTRTDPAPGTAVGSPARD